VHDCLQVVRKEGTRPEPIVSALSMNPPPPKAKAGSKRPLPPPSGGGGGGGLLAGLLSKTTALHSSIRPRAFDAEDALEVATPYMLAKVPAASSNQPINDKECRSPTCNSTSFDIDWRHGDRVCMRCGIVQNTRSMESSDEEHRSFADDENKESKKRAEVNDGTTGGRLGDQSLRAAQGLSNMGGSGAHQGKDEKRLELYKNKLKDLATSMDLPYGIRETANNLATNYVASQVKHDEICQDQHCRLRFVPKRAELVAAMLLKHALRKTSPDLDRQFQEFAQPLRELDAPSFRTELGKVFQVIKDHISAFDQNFAYTCQQTSQGIVAEGDSSTVFLSSITALIARLCGQLRLPYMVQDRATEIYKEWATTGVKASSPQTTAAAAIQAAIEERTAALTQAGIAHPKVVRGATIPGLSDAAGVTEATILKALREAPTSRKEGGGSGGGASSSASAAAATTVEVKTE